MKKKKENCSQVQGMHDNLNIYYLFLPIIVLPILQNMEKYVEVTEKMPNSKVFGKVKDKVSDPLLSAKLGFSHGISNQLRNFSLYFNQKIQWYRFCMKRSTL